MSKEERFLEIYEVIIEEGYEEFYSRDIASHLDIDAGNIGRNINRVLDEYDLPSAIESDRPIDPLKFIIEEGISYNEVESMLDTDNEVVDKREAAMQSVVENLEAGEYGDTELNNTLRREVEKYYDGFSIIHETIGKIKSELENQNLLRGNSQDGWKVKE